MSTLGIIGIAIGGVVVGLIIAYLIFRWVTNAAIGQFLNL